MKLLEATKAVQRKEIERPFLWKLAAVVREEIGQPIHGLVYLDNSQMLHEIASFIDDDAQFESLFEKAIHRLPLR